MPSKRLLAFAAALGLAALAACDQSTGYEAQFPVVTGNYIVYALSGSGPQLPTAFSTVAGKVMQVDTLAFDFAFDLTPAGEVTLLPVTKIGTLVSPRRISFHVDSSSFDDLQRAPISSWVHDSIVTVPIGRTVVIEAPGSCQVYALSQYIYTKMVVDSVDQPARRIYFHATSDPNCGFRSFKAGVPKD